MSETHKIIQAIQHTGLGVYLFVLLGAVLIGTIQLVRSKQRPAITDPAVFGLLMLVFIPTFIQLVIWPDLLVWFRRDTLEVVHHHQYWRVLTSVTVQGGAFGGAGFNLISLLLLAPIAGRLYGVRKMWLCFAGAALVGEIAGLIVLPVGGGNSVGNFGLASLLLIGAIWKSPRWLQLMAAVVLMAGLYTLTWLDIHGFALLGGCLLALWLVSRRGLLSRTVR